MPSICRDDDCGVSRRIKVTTDLFLAARNTCLSISCRSRFWLSRKSASDAASASSCVSRTWSDFSALLSRPDALSRGPRRKPMCSGKIGGRTPLTCDQPFQARPCRSRNFDGAALNKSPILTLQSGTISATVPSATRSSFDFKSNSDWPRFQKRVTQFENDSGAAKILEGGVRIDLRIYDRHAIRQIRTSARGDRARSHPRRA